MKFSESEVMNRRTTLSTAIGLVLFGSTVTANASLTSSATLNFTLGTVQVTCNYGTTPPCNTTPGGHPYSTTDIVGSYFSIDTNGNGLEPVEKTPFGSLNGIHLGTTQSATGGHIGPIDGLESPNIDHPWTFFGRTGMHVTSSPITVVSDLGSGHMTLDFSGWNIIYGNDTPVPVSDIGIVDIYCSDVTCSNGSTYTLDYTGHVEFGGHTTTNYFLHMEGTISNVPVPPAVWLFGTGLLGLAGVARRKQSA